MNYFSFKHDGEICPPMCLITGDVTGELHHQVTSGFPGVLTHKATWVSAPSGRSHWDAGTWLSPKLAVLLVDSVPLLETGGQCGLLIYR